MGLLSKMTKVNVDKVKPLMQNDELMTFLISTIDGFKIREFHGVIFYNQPIKNTKSIINVFVQLKANYFYNEMDKRKKDEDFLKIDTEIGKISIQEFTKKEYKMYGKHKNWKNLPFREKTPKNTQETLYHENGNKKYEGQFKENKCHGQGILYQENGNKLYEGQYKDGKRHGQGIEYRENGNKLYEGQWKDGEMHGQGIEYYENGNKSYEGQWKDGEIHQGIEYDEDGSILFEG